MKKRYGLGGLVILVAGVAIVNVALEKYFTRDTTIVEALNQALVSSN